MYRKQVIFFKVENYKGEKGGRNVPLLSRGTLLDLPPWFLLSVPSFPSLVSKFIYNSFNIDKAPYLVFAMLP